MDWRKKAKYVADRAREKGDIWAVWLNGQAVDRPGDLGTTADPEEANDPGVKILGHYGEHVDEEQILADIAAALGSTPEGEAAEPTRYPPEPENDEPARPENEAEEERPIPDYGGEPAADDPPKDQSPDGDAEQSPSIPHQSSEEEGQEQERKEREEELAKMLRPGRLMYVPGPPTFSSKEINHAKYLLQDAWNTAHRHGEAKRRELYDYLLKKLEEVAA